MSPISQVKSAYTRKKNSLSRQLDSVPALLYDQNVGAERLEKNENVCIAAWNEFKAAYEVLADAQSEEEAQAGDAEEREQEFGNLEASYWDLLGKLADAKASRGRARDDQRVQQDKQAEDERAQQEKRDQVNVHRLRLTSLYGEAREALSRYVTS